jgi:bifunctional DNase/RNase
MLVSVRVKRLGIDPSTTTPVVVLGREDDEREFPIWIGPAEAASIGARLEGKTLERPLTHDLMVGVIAGFGGSLTRVAIDRVERGTIHAKLCLERDGHTLTLEARPSDSIAAALRAGAEIVVNESFLVAERVELTPWEDSERGAP